MGRAERTVEEVQLTRLRFFALAMSGNPSGIIHQGNAILPCPSTSGARANMRTEANIPLLCNVGAAGRISVDYVR